MYNQDPFAPTVENIEARNAGIRRTMAEHLQTIGGELSAMLDLWYRHDLPADFLDENEFPFHRSLEDLVAEVYHSAGLILSNDGEEV